MKSHHSSVLIAYAPRQMFDVVSDVARYEDFLPWCSRSEVLRAYEGGMEARLRIALGPLQRSFTTRNTHTLEPNGACALKVALLDGPFEHLDGLWTFTPVQTESTANACRVNLTLQYAVSSTLLAATLGAAFEKIASRMLEAFVARAHALHRGRNLAA